MEDHHHHRVPLKNNTNTINWKHKLRDNCFNRIQADRNRLLWKLRTSSSPPSLTSLPYNNKDFMQCTFQHIVSDELNKLKNSDTGDVDIWEYDAFQNNSDTEREDILIQMQRFFYQDLTATQHSTNTTEQDDYEGTWEEEEDDYLAKLAFDQLQLNTDQVNVEFLRVRLAEAHSDHLERGCMLAPKFCMETRFNLTALYIQCAACSIFEIVL
ncbi:hypothetical protein AQUCO_12500033v1 [Aquilegia coerulea]|uniref:Uncharacterized protein n=1 Tax=Aquilegia coerulea TaxID=218851 RepID=A0A2G5C1I2_AQUCA|nr:hypothetical protein AQUCO_12500033v1 [Aquilegia coerulea]